MYKPKAYKRQFMNFQSLLKLANANVKLGEAHDNTRSRTNLMRRLQTKATILGHIENNCKL